MYAKKHKTKLNIPVKVLQGQTKVHTDLSSRSNTQAPNSQRSLNMAGIVERNLISAREEKT